MSDTIEIKDGDIFRWSYASNEADHLLGSHRYWAKSCIGVAQGGMLKDTYWGGGNDNACWSFEEAKTALSLEYIGNFNELEKTHEWDADYFDEADCVNLNHPNSSRGNFYIRKGAKRSQSKMLEAATHKREKCVREMCSLAQSVRQLDGLINDITFEVVPLDQIHI